MPLSRRAVLQRAVGAAAFAGMPRAGRAQTYPARPVLIIVPATPGSGGDVTARLMAQWLTERLGRAFVVENRSGASTNIGTELAVRAAPDGYTLLLVSPANTINTTLYENLNFNFLRDVAPVASILHAPEVMEVNPAVPARTVPEFVAYAKANPGKVNFGSSGVGSASHVAGELFKSMTGIDWLHVPYRGPSQAQTGVVAGQVQVYFGPVSAAMPFVRQGQLRALAVTTAARSAALPEIPTVGEFVPGYEASGWFGLGAPRKTSADIVARLNREINAALADPKVKAQLADLGGTAYASTPDEFGRFLADDTAKWAKVIRTAGISAQ
jgi:tripartite-type tricarboxylate transporter receptor subunit TctC